MKRDDRSLHDVAQLRALAVERARSAAVRMREELAQRKAAVSALQAREQKLREATHKARKESAEAPDLAGLRAAADMLRALRQEVAQVNERLRVAAAERARLEAQVRAAEEALLFAEVGKRAVGTVLDSRERAREHKRELSEEDERDQLARARR